MTKYQNLINQFNNVKVLVIGDLMLDRYFKGESHRLCREAPVPIVDVESIENAPGGAANTAVNLAALGAKVTYLTVTGEDKYAKTVITSLKKKNVGSHFIILSKNRKTLVKNRIFAHDQLIVRYDTGSTHKINHELEEQVITTLNKIYSKFEVIIISDYGYGILTPKIIKTLQKLQNREKKVLAIDAKNLLDYEQIASTLVKPNYQEITSLLNIKSVPDGRRVEQVLSLKKRINKTLNAEIVAATLDCDGAVIFEKGKRPYRTYTKAVENSKAAGAGDTYISAFTLAITGGASVLESAEIAAAAAEIVVQKTGTSFLTNEELNKYFLANHKAIENRDELKQLVKAYHEQGRKIVFTNGCFDILHRGHISYLKEAKSLGDILIVGVNDDESVRRLKGKMRPINSLADRLEVLSALDNVDHVVSFSENTPINLIKIVKPDIFVKGGDYTKEKLPEAMIVERLGGQIQILPYMENHSTTQIITQIKNNIPINHYAAS